MQILPDTMGAAGAMDAMGAAAQRPAQAQDTGSTSGTGASSASTATVTANDFLQLLVAEMKNQDPTANTDPNQYINQLVQVNSLEQLVQINQDLGGSSASGTGTSSDGSGRGGAGGNQPVIGAVAGNLSAIEPAGPSSTATRVASAMGRTTNQNPFAANGAGVTAANPFDAITAMRNGAHAGTTTNNSPAR